MLTRLKCSLGHEWEPEGSAPLVCPTCGGAALAQPADEEVGESTVDDENTIDLPAPRPTPSLGVVNGAVAALGGRNSPQMPGTPPGTPPAPGTDPAPRDDVTQTLHFTPSPHLTPPPSSSARMPSTSGHSSGGRSVPGRSMAGAGGGAGNLKPLVMTGMPFVIVRQHARGGLGVVSLARDDQIRREVALKQILPQHVDNPVLKRRFVYEGQITGQLEHPSIVPVYTMGADEAGNPFYVMRFVKGRTLDEIIKEHHASPNPIVFRELLRRFIAVCQAVAYAHSRGVIHRDLKPANVMLGDYGETLVLDWGLAKDIRPGAVDPAAWGIGGKTESGQASMAGAGATLNGRTGSMVQGGGGGGGSPASELTMEGQIIGTPAYMAPEQAEGRTELHGPVTDIYALGGILYKILCGHSPQAPTASTDTPGGNRRLTYVPSPAPSTVSSDVPETLEQICVRAMARDPGGRYARALELAQDVQRWLDEHPLALRPRTGLGRLQGWMRAHVGLMLAVMAGMAVTIAVLGAALLLHGPRK